MVVADFDGIVIIPRADSERVLLEAESIDAAEAAVRSEAAEGTPPMTSFEKHGHI
jgi:regulator of RNase E activity RraA